LKTIAFPLLGAGGCGFPPRVAVMVALREVRGFLETYKDHPFERIIFTSYNSVEEKAFMDYLPVFFPPTHEDIENTAPSEPGSELKVRADLGAQLTKVHGHIDKISRELVKFVEHLEDFRGGQHALTSLAAIMLALQSIKEALLGPKDSIANLNGETANKVEQIYNVLNAVCGSITEIMERKKAEANSSELGFQAIWDDYSARMKSFQGLDLDTLLQMCQYYAQWLEDVLVR
jgi:hypothetical protein